MHLKTQNVNTAFYTLVKDIHEGIIPTTATSSRYGDVLSVDEPVIVTYEKPLERVLFNAERDCNPFFQLYESLWMLSGRNDVASVSYYSKQMKEFSDDGITLNGAYGYRWKHARPYLTYNQRGQDQLEVIINHLKSKLNSRRAVLQMWNVEDDLLKVDTSLDISCNLSVLFKIQNNKLNMTVFNRSNDLTWGMLGANAVHFSVLLEYMAAHLVVKVGVYNQVTDNLHVYTNRWHPEKWLSESQNWTQDVYDQKLNLVPLVEDTSVFDREMPKFVDLNDGTGFYDYEANSVRAWKEPFLQDVCRPFFHAFHQYKLRKEGWFDRASKWLELVKADDWRVVGNSWLKRRWDKEVANVRT